MTRNWKELVNLLNGVLEKDGIEIIRAIMDRIFEIPELPANSKTLQRIEDLTEVRSMLEANTKNWEKAVLEKGIGIGVEKVSASARKKVQIKPYHNNRKHDQKRNEQC